jgi:hypothetical protein
MKTFYGKNFNQLNSDELQLLSIDMQICSLAKKGMRVLNQLALAYKFRAKAEKKCEPKGGNYSRETFLEENGLIHEGPTQEEIQEYTDMMNRATQSLTGLIVDALNEAFSPKPKEDMDDDMNGKEELGFQMN